jgi:hypothetical protein
MERDPTQGWQEITVEEDLPTHPQWVLVACNDLPDRDVFMAALYEDDGSRKWIRRHTIEEIVPSKPWTAIDNEWSLYAENITHWREIPDLPDRPSRGMWEGERQSGYWGFRCQFCATWVYADSIKHCKCDGNLYELADRIEKGSTIRLCFKKEDDFLDMQTNLVQLMTPRLQSKLKKLHCEFDKARKIATFSVVLDSVLHKET